MSTLTEAIATPQPSIPLPARTKERLLSLDVFRGMTLVLMTFVNDHGSPHLGYPPFLHAHWNGWTPTDLVFPFFLFIVGVAIPFAFAGRLERGESKGKLYRHIVYRAVILFALGLLLNCFPRDGGPWFDFSTLRILGTLQRIALCYLAASVIYLNVKAGEKPSSQLLSWYFISS